MGGFEEGAETKARVLAARGEELVAVEELGEVVLSDGADDDVLGDRVDAVVEVAVDDADFVVHDHGAVAAADEVVCACRQAVLARQTFSFQDRRDVVVAVRCLGLAGGQMAVHETERAVVEDESEDQSPLVPV